jgi:hypothetical protein
MRLAEAEGRRKILLELGNKVSELEREGETRRICLKFRICNPISNKNGNGDIPLERTSAYINIVCAGHPSLCKYNEVKLENLENEVYELGTEEYWESYIDAEEVHTRLR